MQEEINTQHQSENSRTEHLKVWQFKPGQSGNPGGRPKGTVSLKEYAKQYLRGLDEEGKEKFMEGLSKDIIWKMAEGMPQTNTDITSAGKPIVTLSSEITNKNAINTFPESNS